MIQVGDLVRYRNSVIRCGGSRCRRKGARKYRGKSVIMKVIGVTRTSPQINGNKAGKLLVPRFRVACPGVGIGTVSREEICLHRRVKVKEVKEVKAKKVKAVKIKDGWEALLPDVPPPLKIFHDVPPLKIFHEPQDGH